MTYYTHQARSLDIIPTYIVIGKRQEFHLSKTNKIKLINVYDLMANSDTSVYPVSIQANSNNVKLLYKANMLPDRSISYLYPYGGNKEYDLMYTSYRVASLIEAVEEQLYGVTTFEEQYSDLLDDTNCTMQQIYETVSNINFTVDKMHKTCSSIFGNNMEQD